MAAIVSRDEDELEFDVDLEDCFGSDEDFELDPGPCDRVDTEAEETAAATAATAAATEEQRQRQRQRQRERERRAILPEDEFSLVEYHRTVREARETAREDTKVDAGVGADVEAGTGTDTETTHRSPGGRRHNNNNNNNNNNNRYGWCCCCCCHSRRRGRTRVPTKAKYNVTGTFDQPSVCGCGRASGHCLGLGAGCLDSDVRCVSACQTCCGVDDVEGNRFVCCVLVGRGCCWCGSRKARARACWCCETLFLPPSARRGDAALFTSLLGTLFAALCLTALIIATADSPLALLLIPILFAATIPMCAYQVPCVTGLPSGTIVQEAAALVDGCQGAVFTAGPGLLFVLAHTGTISTLAAGWGAVAWAAFYYGYLGILVALRSNHESGDML